MIYRSKALTMLCAAALLVLPAAAMAAGRSFYVNNTNAKVSVQRVWYAQAGTNENWEEVFLDYPIKPNNKSSFTMGSGDVCLYDIKIKFSDGYEQTFENVNVCRGDGVHAT